MRPVEAGDDMATPVEVRGRALAALLYRAANVGGVEWVALGVEPFGVICDCSAEECRALRIFAVEAVMDGYRSVGDGE